MNQIELGNLNEALVKAIEGRFHAYHYIDFELPHQLGLKWKITRDGTVYLGGMSWLERHVKYRKEVILK